MTAPNPLTMSLADWEYAISCQRQALLAERAGKSLTSAEMVAAVDAERGE